MSNLGRYQDIVTEAARAGGVDKLVKSIESGAVARAAPALIGKGVGVGVAVTVGAGLATVAGKRAWERLKSRQATGEAAAAALAAIVSDDGRDANGIKSDPE